MHKINGSPALRLRSGTGDEIFFFNCWGGREEKCARALLLSPPPKSGFVLPDPERSRRAGDILSYDSLKYSLVLH